MFGYGKLLFVVEGTRKSLVTLSLVTLIVITMREFPGLKNSSCMWRSILHYLGSKKDRDGGGNIDLGEPLLEDYNYFQDS
jgi:hypothetical protein